MNILQKIKTKTINERWDLVLNISDKLKSFISEQEFPEWMFTVKTGRHVERLPLRQDWPFIRMASMLIYLTHNPRGIAKIRSRYGGVRNRGSKPNHKYPASGAMCRNLIHILEKHELISQHKKGKYTSEKGRIIILEQL